MAEGDRQLAFTTGPVPTSVEVSGPDRITPKTVNASFDGTGAAGAFLPCLIIVGRTGLEVARIPAPQVAAGASAEVSWFPRVAAEAPVGGGGIQFNTDNEGGWLYVESNDEIAGVNPDYDGFGIALVDGEDDGIVIDSDSGLSLNTVQNGGITVGQPGNGQPIALNGRVTLDGTFDAGGAQLRGGADGTDPTDFATVGQIGGSLKVTDGVTSVDPTTEITFSGATVTDAGGGNAHVALSGGSGGTELDYVQRVTDLSVTATSAATADTFIDGNAVTYDGSTRVKIEVFVPYAPSTGDLWIELYDGSTDLGQLGSWTGTAGGAGPVIYGATFITPTAAVHTFHIKAWKGPGTSSLKCAPTLRPAWYRITTAY